MTGPQRQIARPSWPTRAGLLALLIASLISWSLAPAARAQGHIYWAWGTSINPFDPAPSGVDRANLDGTGVDQSFINFHGNPIAIAVDGAHIYWLNTDIRASTIGRANLDGTGVEPSFIPGVGFPYDLAVDGAHIYWAHGGGIGRANLDGTGADLSFIEPPRDVGWTPAFYGVAVSGANIYWSYREIGFSGHIPGVPPINSIGCANIDGTGANYGLVTANARNVALDAAHVYWTTSVGIGRANLDGTAAQEGFIPAHGDTGVTVDAAHVYWSGGAGGHIGRANLDGSGVEPALIAGVGARDVAVDGPPPGSPATSSCPPPAPPAPPDNSFSLGKLKRNLKKGTAKLTVKVPGPGALRLRKTKRVRKDTEQVAETGKVRLTIRPRPKGKSKLAETGKVKVNARVRYTPTGGEPNTESRGVTLKLSRR